VADAADAVSEDVPVEVGEGVPVLVLVPVPVIEGLAVLVKEGENVGVSDDVFEEVLLPVDEWEGDLDPEEVREGVMVSLEDPLGSKGGEAEMEGVLERVPEEETV